MARFHRMGISSKVRVHTAWAKDRPEQKTRRLQYGTTADEEEDVETCVSRQPPSPLHRPPSRGRLAVSPFVVVVGGRYDLSA